MQISVNVDTRELENRLYLLARAARVTPGVVIKEETKGVTQNIIRLTPPRSLAQGRKAVARDIGRVVTGVPNVEGESKSPVWKAVNRLAKRGETDKINKILGGWRGRPRFTSAAADIKREHIARRNNYGKVRGAPRLVAMATEARKYLREVQARVGWAKSAWVPALMAAGGSAAGWIRRHAAQSGIVAANFGENPKVYAAARDVKIPGYQRIVSGAVRTREKITQRKIDRIVSGKAVNLGFIVIPGK